MAVGDKEDFGDFEILVISEEVTQSGARPGAYHNVSGYEVIGWALRSFDAGADTGSGVTVTFQEEITMDGSARDIEIETVDGDAVGSAANVTASVIRRGWGPPTAAAGDQKLILGRHAKVRATLTMIGGTWSATLALILRRQRSTR